MSGLHGAENVSPSERNALAEKGPIASGRGLGLVRMPVGSSWSESAFVVRPCAKGEVPFAVASHRSAPLTQPTVGRIVLCSAPFFQVLVSTGGKQGDLIAIVDDDGSWGVVGSSPVARLVEDCAAGALAWATRLV